MTDKHYHPEKRRLHCKINKNLNVRVKRDWPAHCRDTISHAQNTFWLLLLTGKAVISPNGRLTALTIATTIIINELFVALFRLEVFDQLLLNIARNKLVAGKLHDERSAPAGQ